MDGWGGRCRLRSLSRLMSALTWDCCFQASEAPTSSLGPGPVARGSRLRGPLVLTAVGPKGSQVDDVALIRTITSTASGPAFCDRPSVAEQTGHENNARCH